MEKRIIVVENCCKCPYAIEDGLNELDPEFDCYFTGLPCPRDGFPDWCKLSRMPKKMAEPETTDHSRIGSYAWGWNDCIDKIGGEDDVSKTRDR